MIIPDDAIELSGHIFSGEYDVKRYTREKPSILDIGANIGAFARWSMYRWPGCTIKCYEPVKHNYEYLIENTKDNPNIECFNVAVGEKQEKKIIYYGLQNCGECSFIKGDQQREHGEEVNVYPASNLEYADIVKIDTEGWELQIVSNLSFKPDLFLLEYHSIQQRNAIVEYLNDYTLIEFSMMSKPAGLMKLARTDIV